VNAPNLASIKHGWLDKHFLPVPGFPPTV